MSNGMTPEEKVIYILRRSFHETPNDAAMMHIARSIIGALNEPPTEDEREALARVIGDSGAGGQSAWTPEYADPSWEFMRDMDRLAADAILASPEWRNRHRGPITDREVQAFKDAWHEADIEGDSGNRVRRGLAAVLEVKDSYDD